jgi:hypothetical protein
MRAHSDGLAYNALHRLEVRHNLRQIRRTPNGAIAWQILRSAEESRSRLLGYNVDLLGLFQSAELISARHEAQIECGASDLIHLAGAIDAGALFVTCDVAQAEAARLEQIERVLIGE